MLLVVNTTASVAWTPFEYDGRSLEYAARATAGHVRQMASQIRLTRGLLARQRTVLLTVADTANLL
jgi:hypothetical protein